jgi:hypothetical protein
MLKFETRVLQFEFNGEVQRINYPTVKRIKELNELQKKETDEVVALEKFLLDLGMKQEVFDKLEVGAMNTIVEHLVDAKK